MKKLNNKGFSLVELIIVIAIMVILVVVIAPQYTKFVSNSRIAADVQTAQALATAIDVAVANDEKPFTDSGLDFTKISGVTEMPTSKYYSGTAFAVTGDNTNGVSKITVNSEEVYPNPDAGINTHKK